VRLSVTKRNGAEAPFLFFTWAYPAALLECLRQGPAFSGESREKEHQGSALDPVEVGADLVRHPLCITWPAALCPRWVTACPPAGHAAAQVSSHVPARQPVARHGWPADAEKQVSHHQRKGSRGKKHFPLAFFPPFLMGEMGSRRRRFPTWRVPPTSLLYNPLFIW